MTSGTSIDTLKALTKVGWLAEQPLPFQKRMAQIGRWVSVRRGQVLYSIGDDADSMYGLGDGLLDVSIAVNAEHDVIIHRAAAGLWIGDSAILSGSGRAVTLTAASDAQVFKLSGAVVLQSLAQYPEDWICFYRLSHMNITRCLQALAEVISLPPRTRFVRALLRLTAVMGQIQVTQEELSAMVGMSRATFRRAFSALIDQGTVEIKYGSIVVQDRAALEIEALKTED